MINNKFKKGDTIFFINNCSLYFLLSNYFDLFNKNISKRLIFDLLTSYFDCYLNSLIKIITNLINIP